MTKANKSSFSVRMGAVLLDRMSEVFSRDTEIAMSYLGKNSTSIDALFDSPAFKEQGNKLVKNARIANAADDRANFIAVKVLVKVMHFASAMGSTMRGEIDNHTQIIGFQLAKLDKLTNKSAHVAQCKSVEYSALDTVQALDLKHKANYSIGTTSTQTSSTRMLLLHTGLCDVQKGKRDDVITVQDNARARAFIALFKGVVIPEALQSEVDGVALVELVPEFA